METLFQRFRYLFLEYRIFSIEYGQSAWDM